MNENEIYLVSACLAGFHCRYDGKSNYNSKIVDLVKSGKAIPVCPEQLGGLSTPRSASEIKCIHGSLHVINKLNEDVTTNFENGANEVLNIAHELGIKKAILQARSPSCGCGKIYNGSFDKTLIDGNGITAKLLLENGIEVINSDNF